MLQQRRRLLGLLDLPHCDLFGLIQAQRQAVMLSSTGHKRRL
jgi:hypothetical protein